MLKNILILYNPHSGRIQRDMRKNVQRTLEKRGIGYFFEEFTEEDLWKEDQNPNEYDLLLVIGGDGSIKSVVDWALMKQSHTPLGIIPFGSGNIFSKALDIPTSPNRALEVALSEQYCEIDVGRVNEKEHFLIGVGVGFDALMIRHTSKILKKYFGLWSYFVGAIKGLFSLRSVNFSVVTNEKKYQFGARVFVVCNTNRFLGVNFHSSVALNDGKLNLLTFKERMFSDFFRKIIGREKMQDLVISNIASKKFQITFSEKSCVQIDGEERDYGELEIETLEKAIRVAVPAENFKIQNPNVKSMSKSK